MTFNTPKRRQLVRITDDVARCCQASGIAEGMGEDNGDAHLKNLLIGHQVIVPITKGQLDLGPWQQIFYFEFDGRRPKRLVLKAMGE
jgi:thiamine phosphate synthase YjbQ (UPF0047 family)